MKIDLSEDATTFGAHVRSALGTAGGDELLKRAEADPTQRGAVEPVLAELGAWELEPRLHAPEVEAAAALCRAAGWWAVPYPVAERVARPVGLEVEGLVVVDEATPVATIAGIDLRWAAVTISGRRSMIVESQLESPRATAFAAPLNLEPLDETDAADVALGLVLPCWTLLGMLDRALALTRSHVLDRRQFGQRLADFQGVQFQLTEAEVERVGTEELGKYALWSIQSAQASALSDALAFRLAALEAAAVVFRTAHQLHGAIGFCDETVVSWLSRYSAPLRRHPYGVAGTTAKLTAALGSAGLPGLFNEAIS